MDCETAEQITPPLPTGKPAEGGNRATADSPPSAEFAEMILARVQIHVQAGNWSIALRTIRTAATEWQELVREQLAAGRRTPAEWLARPLHELGLPSRSTNALEDAGCVTIADGLAMVADRALWPPDFGEFRVDEVRCAARRLGLSVKF